MLSKQKLFYPKLFAIKLWNQQAWIAGLKRTWKTRPNIEKAGIRKQKIQNKKKPYRRNADLVFYFYFKKKLVKKGNPYGTAKAKRAEWGGSLDFSIGLELVKNVILSVTSIFSHNFEDRIGITLKLIAQNLAIRFLMFCLGHEIFEVKDGGWK